MRKSRANAAPWRFVTPTEFEALLQRYPRGLVADPPLPRQCRHRSFFDPALGLMPANAIAVANTSRRGATFEVRTDISDWPTLT